jgi:4-diphosphocytidyl-2-C-methyl-D-erythritol kinase
MGNLKRAKLKRALLNKVYLSPAKINLFFCVLGKYGKGYHEVYSLMTALDFFDSISFIPSSHDSFVCNYKQVDSDPDNLVLRALKLFRQETSLIHPMAITLTKRIPLGSGLGGGSSNAATTLFALNEIFNYPLLMTDLIELAENLGSDVPFFLSSGQALVTQKGGGLRNLQIDSLLPITLYLSRDIHASTKTVFSKLESYSSRNKGEHLLQSALDGDIVFHNDLFSPTMRLYPELDKRCKNLLHHGVKPHLSGSGSTLFSFQRPPADLVLRPLELVFANPVQRRDKSWY